MEKIEYPEKYATYWSKLLDIEIDEIDWINMYEECVTWTISVKLRSFYYQYRMRDIMCNSKLYKMGKVPSMECEWCGHDKQDVTHLFWYCPKSQIIWNFIQQYINDTMNCELEIKCELIILFDIEAGNLTRIFNLIMLITCRYIYICKCIGELPSCNGVLRKIKDIETLERMISINNNKLSLHLKKWGKFAPHIV